MATSANTLIYATGPDAFALTPLTPYGRSLIDDVDAPTARTTLGLGGAAVLNVGTTTGTVAAGDDARFAKPTAVTGLQLQWVSNTALTVGTGSFALASGTVLNVATAIAKTGLSLTASTFYHVYGFLNGSTPDIEIVTTAPAAPYQGRARAKTGDTTRRYLGSVLTDASGNLLNFHHDEHTNTISYKATGGGITLVAGGNATTSTSLGTTTICPATALSCRLLLRSAGSGLDNARVTAGNVTPSTTVTELFVTAQSTTTTGRPAVYGDIPLDGQAAVNYITDVGTAAVTIACIGYIFGR